MCFTLGPCIITTYIVLQSAIQAAEMVYMRQSFLANMRKPHIVCLYFVRQDYYLESLRIRIHSCCISYALDISLPCGTAPPAPGNVQITVTIAGGAATVTASWEVRMFNTCT